MRLADGLDGVRVPEARGFIPTAGDDTGAVRAEGDSENRVLMALEWLANGQAGVRIPHSRRVLS